MFEFDKVFCDVFQQYVAVTFLIQFAAALDEPEVHQRRQPVDAFVVCHRLDVSADSIHTLSDRWLIRSSENGEWIVSDPWTGRTRFTLAEGDPDRCCVFVGEAAQIVFVSPGGMPRAAS